MHSEHILKERSDAQNVVSRFPCGMQPFYTTRGASRALFCPLRREISPLRSASVEMTIGVLANIVISSGDACRYGADGKRIDDTLSPEISQRNAVPRTIRGGDFSTPLRYGRNDDRARLFFIKSAPEGRHHHPRPEGLSPPERKRRNPSTQPAAPAAPPSFIICARRAPPQPSACKAVKLKNPWAVGPSILRTFLPAPKRPYTIDNAPFLPYNNIVMEGCPSG